MPRLAWSDMLATGDSVVDDQHRILIDIINAFLDAMDSGQGHDAIQSCLSELLVYAGIHFRDEEALMARIGFAGLESHSQEHERLLALAEEHLTHCINANESVRDVHVFLKTWFVDHILGWDFKIMEHARGIAG